MLFDHFYLKSKLSAGLTGLYAHSVVKYVGTGLTDLFLPIFLFERLGGSVTNIILFYLAYAGLFFLFVSVGAMTMSKIGLKISMILAVAFLGLYYFSFYVFQQKNEFALIVLSLVAITFFQILFWVSYHTDFAKFTDRSSRGRQLSVLSSAISLTSFVIPALSGFIIQKFGFDALFVIAIVLILTSAFPLFSLPDVREKFDYSYFQTFREFFRRKNRKMALAYGSDGAQSIVGAVIWPIFIYQLMKGEYLAVGLISSVIVAMSIIFQLATGSFADKMDKRRLVKIGSVLYAMGWVGKAFIQTGFQIFVVGAYHSFSSIMMRTPFDAMMYDKSADQGHQIDEYSVIREMAVNGGRVLMLLLLLVLFSFTSASLGAAFLIAAAVSLLVNIL